MYIEHKGLSKTGNQFKFFISHSWAYRGHRYKIQILVTRNLSEWEAIMHSATCMGNVCQATFSQTNFRSDLNQVLQGGFSLLSFN